MSNVSMKEQLQAVASKLSANVDDTQKPVNKPAIVKKIKKLKPMWLDYVQYGVELLKVYFPACFKSGVEMKPLKKGIKQDLVTRLSTMDIIVTEDKACMVKSLAYYVNTAAYHKSVIEGDARVDLDGKPDGIVLAQEAQYAIERQQAKLQVKKTRPQSLPHQRHPELNK